MASICSGSKSSTKYGRYCYTKDFNIRSRMYRLDHLRNKNNIFSAMSSTKAIKLLRLIRSYDCQSIQRSKLMQQQTDSRVWQGYHDAAGSIPCTRTDRLPPGQDQEQWQRPVQRISRQPRHPGLRQLLPNPRPTLIGYSRSRLLNLEPDDVTYFILFCIFNNLDFNFLIKLFFNFILK